MSTFRDQVIAYIKLLIYKCSGYKNQLRAPIEEYFKYANPIIEEKSSTCDFIILTFGKEIIKLEVHYEERPKMVKRRNYNTNETYELQIDDLFEYFVNEIK